MTRAAFVAVGILLAFSLLLAGCAKAPVQVTQEQGGDPVVESFDHAFEDPAAEEDPLSGLETLDEDLAALE